MLSNEVLMSDAFVEFSAKIAALHEKKKKMLVEIQKVYEKHKAEVKEIDNEVTRLQQEFDASISPKGKK